jgi:hypothetical protein
VLTKRFLFGNRLLSLILYKFGIGRHAGFQAVVGIIQRNFDSKD